MTRKLIAILVSLLSKPNPLTTLYAFLVSHLFAQKKAFAFIPAFEKSLQISTQRSREIIGKVRPFFFKGPYKWLRGWTLGGAHPYNFMSSTLLPGLTATKLIKLPVKSTRAIPVSGRLQWEQERIISLGDKSNSPFSLLPNGVLLRTPLQYERTGG